MKDEQISLCAITHNCEEIIVRFIDQFRSLVDEICIVRAIGKNQKHDKTLSIALEKGCRVGEFKGQVDDWPHTHHFGDARNAAWEMATCEWQMWADIDDSIDEDSIKEFRRLIRDSPENIEMIRAAYVVPDQGITQNIRERIMRRGKFIWHQPVHECVKSIDNHKYDYIDARKACITHAAKSDRRASCERNLRILEVIPEKERSSGTYYYLFSEYYGLQEKLKAVQAAEKALSFPDIGGTEKYEILLILSTMSESPDKMAALLHAAHQTLPFRREALFELCNLEMTFGNADRALAYCRQMMALPKPDIVQWNLRGKFYEWAGDQLETSVERFNNREARANALEFNRFKDAKARSHFFMLRAGELASL
jgi:tetratricopeptide (TPR) repeat protein